MGSEWHEKEIGCLPIKLIDGDRSSKYPKRKEFQSSGVVFLNAESITTGRVDLTKVNFIKPEKFQTITKGRLENSDLIITMRGNGVGDLALYNLIDQDGLINAQMLILRPDPNRIDPHFLYYQMSNPFFKLKLQGFVTGSAQPQLTVKHLKHVPVKVLPLSEQKKIVSILKTLDHKIELNRKMNATLESMAQTLFKSWFVDFDPVIDNALVAGNPIPEAFAQRAQRRQEALNNGTANRDISEHFPDSFQHTEEMGWTPQGWNPKPVNKIALINPPTKLAKGAIAPYVDMKSLPTSGYSINDLIKKEYKGGSKFKNDDTLMARITPCLENGKTALVDCLEDAFQVGFGSTEFIVFRPQKNISSAFLACLVRDKTFRRHCIQSMVGSSGRQRVQASCFNSFFLALPNHNNVFKLFNLTSDTFFKKISISARENKALTKLRDTLLPKLISGELRIPDAEKLIAEVTNE